MARCAFATWRPLPENSQQGRISPRAVILHTAWSAADSLYSFFRNSSNLESHFYVNERGVIEQYMDTAVRADANYNANDFAVSIETWDGRAIRPWNGAQVDALVRLVGWICDVHAIPKRRIPAWDSSGIGWHVQFGAPGPWTPVAKSCPGAPRIDQTKNVIIPRVAGGGAGGGGTDVIPAEQMRELKDCIRVVGSRETVRWLDHGDPTVVGAGNNLKRVREDITAVRQEVAAVHAAIDQVGTPEIDYARLAAEITSAQAAATADELHRRLAS